MSQKGVLGAIVFFVAIFFFGGAAIAFDAYLHHVGGDDATITYGVRWLTAYAPWTVMTFVFLFAFATGFLFCHFWGAPKLFGLADSPDEEARKERNRVYAVLETLGWYAAARQARVELKDDANETPDQK